MKNTARLSNLFIGVVVLVIICLGARFLSTRKDVTARPYPCEMNLRTIELAKIEWADNQINVDTNHVPTWVELQPYLPAIWSNNIPTCPSGGTYTIGRVGEPPTCSIGGTGHSLPK
jgi:hypothetical protein